MAELAKRMARAWGPWLAAPLVVLTLSGIFLAVGYQRHPREPNGLIQFVFFLILAPSA